MTAGPPAPQDAETVDVRQAVIDALVMSPMSDAAGTSMAPIERTADDVLAALAPVRAREVEAARRDGAREALETFADSRGVNVSEQFDSEWWRGYRQAQRECLQDALRLAATPTDDEQHDTKEDDR